MFGLAGNSYTVRVRLRRLRPDRGFSLGLPVGDNMVTFALDTVMDGGPFTALSLGGVFANKTHFRQG
jgi:hypothetical protein